MTGSRYCYARSHNSATQLYCITRWRHYHGQNMNMTEVLTTAQLRRLTEHKYSSEGTSVTEPVMQKFWRWLVEQVPLWWSPNAMTLTGLIINAVSTSILIMYSPDARQEVRKIMFFYVKLYPCASRKPFFWFYHLSSAHCFGLTVPVITTTSRNGDNRNCDTPKR